MNLFWQKLRHRKSQIFFFPGVMDILHEKLHVSTGQNIILFIERFHFWIVFMIFFGLLWILGSLCYLTKTKIDDIVSMTVRSKLSTKRNLIFQKTSFFEKLKNRLDR